MRKTENARKAIKAKLKEQGHIVTKFFETLEGEWGIDCHACCKYGTIDLEREDMPFVGALADGKPCVPRHPPIPVVKPVPRPPRIPKPIDPRFEGGAEASTGQYDWLVKQG